MGKFQLERTRKGDMIEAIPERTERNAEAPAPAGFTDFLEAGRPVAGEFHCRGCGYGVIVQRELPRCPMCSGTAWEQAGWGAIRGRASEPVQ
jgi:rubrerythrin